MKQLSATIALYRYVTQWNGEAVSDLQEQIKAALVTVPVILLRPLTFALRRLRSNRSLRFDLSRIDGPLCAIDAHGRALVGTLTGLRVVQLQTLDTRDHTYDIAPRTASLRTRRIAQ